MLTMAVYLRISCCLTINRSTHSLPYTLTHLLPYLPTYSLTHPLIQYLRDQSLPDNPSITHSLSRSIVCFGQAGFYSARQQKRSTHRRTQLVQSSGPSTSKGQSYEIMPRLPAKYELRINISHGTTGLSVLVRDHERYYFMSGRLTAGGTQNFCLLYSPVNLHPITVTESTLI